jgi:hypothetical protein
MRARSNPSPGKPLSFLSLILLWLVVPSTAQAGTSGGQEAGSPVGTIEMVVDGATRTFEVREGPITEGFSTGFREMMRGEAMVRGASLQGFEEGSDAQVVVRISVAGDPPTHHCDPMANGVELSPAQERASRMRLRPGGTNSSSCPDSPVDVTLTQATFDEDTGALQLVGTFSGPLGRGDAALQVSEGHFEATVHSFQAIGSG